MQVIAAFDFDGTITKRDTMLDFVRFVKGDIPFFLGLLRLSPILAFHKVGFLSSQSAKERFLTYFLGGMQENDLYKMGQLYCKERLPKLIRPKARARIEWHRKNQHPLYLVTASLPFWTKEWAIENGFVLVATQAEIQDNLFTGKITGKNCHKSEKVKRLTQILGTQKPYKVYAYGDTNGDADLLAWAAVPAFQAFV